MQGATSKGLAFAAAVLGFVGLALSLAGGPLAAVGLILAALALLGLLAVAWLALEPPATAPDALQEAGPASNPDFEYAEPDQVQRQGDEWLEDTVPPPPPSGEPVIDLDSPLQRALAGLPPKPAAPGRYSPRMPVIPADEEEEEDAPVRRARRLVPSGQTLGEKREAVKRAKAKPAPEELEFTVVPGPSTARPAVVPAPKVPLVTASTAGKGPPPPNMARGKCSGCGTLLWAPKTRPISLRCPQCDKITLLR